MAVNKKLKKYKLSDEFAELLKKCENKADTIKDEIIALYKEGNIDNTIRYNDFDMRDVELKVIPFFLENITSDLAEDLIKDLKETEKTQENYLCLIHNHYGFANSQLKYTELDKKRFERNVLLGISQRLDRLIGSDDKVKKEAQGAF